MFVKRVKLFHKPVQAIMFLVEIVVTLLVIERGLRVVELAIIDCFSKLFNVLGNLIVK